MVWASFFDSINHFGRGALNLVESPIRSIGHTAQHGAQIVHDDLSAAIKSIKNSAAGTVKLIQDDLHHASNTLIKSANSAASIIGAGAQGGLDAFTAIGGVDVLKGLGQNLVADTNIPGILSNAATPLVTGIGGAVAAVAAIIGLALLSKA